MPIFQIAEEILDAIAEHTEKEAAIELDELREGKGK